MKTNLPTNIDKWSFNKNKTFTFIEKYDVIIIIALFSLAYFLIF